MAGGLQRKSGHRFMLRIYLKYLDHEGKTAPDSEKPLFPSFLESCTWLDRCDDLPDVSI